MDRHMVRMKNPCRCRKVAITGRFQKEYSVWIGASSEQKILAIIEVPVYG